MLSLNSPRWSELTHAYGPATDTPALLRQLAAVPDSKNNAEPWFTLWSSLAHQGDVYSASFAAVPHVIHALSTAPERASFDYFAFPAWIEICRQRSNVSVPGELSTEYFAALSSLGALVGEAASRDWDMPLMQSAMSALAVSRGFVRIAEAAQELNEETADQLLKHIMEQ